MIKAIVVCVVSLFALACDPNRANSLLGEQVADAGGNELQDPEQCADAASTWYAGRFGVGFEASGFRQCGLEDPEVWWLDQPSASDLAEGFDVPPDQGDILVIYAELCGVVSPPGEYGPGGGSDHELIVTQIFYRSETIPDSCESSPSE
jgi:hypothetical protein